SVVAPSSKGSKRSDPAVLPSRIAGGNSSMAGGRCRIADKTAHASTPATSVENPVMSAPEAVGRRTTANSAASTVATTPSSQTTGIRPRVRNLADPINRCLLTQTPGKAPPGRHYTDLKFSNNILEIILVT